MQICAHGLIQDLLQTQMNPQTRGLRNTALGPQTMVLIMGQRNSHLE